LCRVIHSFATNSTPQVVVLQLHISTTTDFLIIRGGQQNRIHKKFFYKNVPTCTIHFVFLYLTITLFHIILASMEKKEKLVAEMVMEKFATYKCEK